MKGAIRAAFPSLPWDATGGPQAVQQVAGMGSSYLLALVVSELSVRLMEDER